MCPECAAPKFITQNHDGALAERRTIRIEEASSERGTDFQDFEIIARSKGPDNLLRTFSAQRCCDRRRVCNETRKDVVIISILAVFGIGRSSWVVINIPEDSPAVT